MVFEKGLAERLVPINICGHSHNIWYKNQIFGIFLKTQYMLPTNLTAPCWSAIILPVFKYLHNLLKKLCLH